MSALESSPNAGDAHARHPLLVTDTDPPDVPLPCACLGEPGSWLEGRLAGLDDEEGERLPTSLPTVVDAHVHVFPDGVFEALWRWFEAHAWPLRYKLRTPEVVRFMLSRGVSHVVALHYAHKPGMARVLNAYVADLCRREPRVVGMATVLPGEEGAVEILEEAFASGLRGVKLHCHVQCFAPDAPELHGIYEACARADRPLVMHAGREPASPHYRCDPHALCHADRVERVLRDHPKLKLCVPHLGADELGGYERLLGLYDNLWLDTTMVVGGFFPLPSPERLLRCRPERILYGTDFPNLPYAWDREIRVLAGMGLREEELSQILGQTARDLFGIAED